MKSFWNCLKNILLITSIVAFGIVTVGSIALFALGVWHFCLWALAGDSNDAVISFMALVISFMVAICIASDHKSICRSK